MQLDEPYNFDRIPVFATILGGFFLFLEQTEERIRLTKAFYKLVLIKEKKQAMISYLIVFSNEFLETSSFTVWFT